MKKTISLIAFALLLSFSSAYAQKHLYFGLGGSYLTTGFTNQNNYGLDFQMDYVAKYGISGNLNVGFDFTNHLGAKLEIGTGPMGQKYKDTHNGKSYERDIDLNYIQVPLLFKFRTAGNVAKFYAMVGPQFSFLTSAKQTYLENGVTWNKMIVNPITNQPLNVSQEDIKERYNSMDIMARVDLGVDIMLGKSLFLNVGATMAYGLIDINATDYRIPDNYFATPSGTTYNPSHNFYGGINVGINYMLPIGGK